MRPISEFERNIIDRIVNQHQLDFVSLVDHYMIDKDILLDFQNDTATILFDQAVYMPNNNQGANNLIDEVLNISEVLIATISLLEYLQENKYLKLIQASPNPNPPRFGRLIQGSQFIQYQIYDKDITESLLKNTFKTVRVEQSLIEFVNDGFISKEEKRHRQNIKWAKIGFIAAIIIGLLTLIVGSIGTYFDRATYFLNKHSNNGQKIIKQDSCISTEKRNFIKVKVTNDFTTDTINVNLINDFKDDTFNIKI
jgi:hypothetical protein